MIGSLRPWVVVLLLAAATAFGLWSEWVRIGFNQPRVWVPDLLTGLTIVAAGLFAWTQRPASRVGFLLVLTGVGWFAANLDRAVHDALAAEPTLGRVVATGLRVAYQGPLAHAILSYPSGSLRSTSERLAGAVSYGAIAVRAIWPIAPAGSAVAVLVAGVAALSFRRALGPRRRPKLLALQVSWLVAAALLIGQLLAIAAGPRIADESSVALYELAIAATAILLAYGLRSSAEGSAVADLVVELGEPRSGPLRDALAEALGDPSLQVGYRQGPGDGYVDAGGRPIELPLASSGRALTLIERDGGEAAVLIHDAAVLDDSAVVDAIAAADRLASRNAALQAEVRGQMTALQASRRRLVATGDTERQRLVERLNKGAMDHLQRLADALDGAPGAAAGDAAPSESGQRIARARAQVDRTAAELRELALGLHPPDLRDGGLGPALAELTARLPFPVDLDVADVRLPPEIDAALYYLCAEGLSNAAKHAHPSCATVLIRTDGIAVSLTLSDDGDGGADHTRGSGLRGLADRVEALGGSLTVSSPPGQGTRLTTVVPLRGRG